ncbi:HipA domain-containing protein [Thiomicrorhabdus sp. 6S2-11]|uniref:HipA domain-containing protein n=1 Tax=Thiomicrorhabdus marina TaxID=2818442 RepID=A0ABS3Q5J4_9GAMM|nr:HipA domain-containing protein [Thiomicrorhabdus marina]MBO1927572.1 HipA domain-containing protein [Thiomicrorhabdus marina]
MIFTLQIFHHQVWQDAASLAVDLETRQVSLEYLDGYKVAYLFENLETACSVNYPVEIFQTYRRQGWFGFIDDILPSGSSRRYWLQKLGIAELSVWQQDLQLLQEAVIAPVGNLRIKEAVPEKFEDSLQQKRFSIQEVISLNIDFLEYAQEMGAVSGGATGAGGEAPKLLVRQSDDQQIWIDTYQDDLDNLDQHYLVKFPRGRGALRDRQILQAEYAYLQELHRLQMNAIDISKTRLEIEGEAMSLWLPRFDVCYQSGKVEHFALESVFSILEKPAGSVLNHFDVIDGVCDKLRNAQTFDSEAFVREWVKRDFLNVIFANSDNHGRNSALIKKHGHIELSPIYDFAPMRADLEQIVRTIKWGRPYEAGGEFDWQGIVDQLNELTDTERLWQEMRQLASQLLGLKQRLVEYGVDEDFLEIPVLGMNTIDARLQRWQLL